MEKMPLSLEERMDYVDPEIVAKRFSKGPAGEAGGGKSGMGMCKTTYTFTDKVEETK